MANMALRLTVAGRFWCVLWPLSSFPLSGSPSVFAETKLQQLQHLMGCMKDRIAVELDALVVADKSGRFSLLKPRIQWHALRNNPLQKILKDLCEGVTLPDLLQVPTA